MTSHRALNIALAIVGALVIGAMLSAAHLLDGPDDAQAERDQATALLDAQRQAQREARQERAAAQLCARLRGEAAYRWTDAGELVCLDRQGRGHVVVATARGAL